MNSHPSGEVTEVALEVLLGRSCPETRGPRYVASIAGCVRPGVQYVEPVPSPAARQGERTGSVANVSVDETPRNTQTVMDTGTSSFVESPANCAKTRA